LGLIGFDVFAPNNLSLRFFTVRPFNEQSVAVDARRNANISPEAGEFNISIQGRIVHSGVQRPIEYQRNLPDHWGRSRVRGIALHANNAGNIDTVVNGRIHTEKYRAFKALRNVGRALPQNRSGRTPIQAKGVKVVFASA
jgi:hypothetical protein